MPDRETHALPQSGPVHLYNPLTLSKLGDFNEVTQQMFAEFGESGNPSAHVLTPMGAQSPR